MKKLLLIALMFWAAPAWATTYYVNKSGNDSNSCATAQSATDANAKLTIAEGIACLSGGDTLIIGNGTYNERIATRLQSIPSGSPGAPTIIRAENQRLAIVQPNDATLNDGWFYGVSIDEPKSYITVDGIVSDVTLTTGYGYIAQVHSGELHHIVFQNGETFGADGDCAEYLPIYGYISGCAGVVAGSHNNASGNHHISILNMWSHDNTEGGAYNSGATDVLVEGNEFGPRNGYGYQAYDSGHHASTNHVVRKNNMHDNDTHPGYPVFNWTVMFTDVPGGRFENNLVTGNHGGIYVGYTTQSGAQISFNTVYGNSLECVFVDAGSSGTLVRNNICRSNGSDVVSNSGSSTTATNNLLGTDPLFVSPGAGDFRLKVGSPAIGTGVFIAGIPTDITGSTRPNPPSRGAYDVGSAPAALFTISPTSGNQGSTINISVHGLNTNFVDATSAMTFSGTGITVNSTTVSSLTAALVNITIDGGATLSTRSCTMTTGAEVVNLSSCFTVAGAPTAPTNLRTVFDPLIAIPRIAIASEAR